MYLCKIVVIVGFNKSDRFCLTVKIRLPVVFEFSKLCSSDVTDDSSLLLNLKQDVIHFPGKISFKYFYKGGISNQYQTKLILCKLSSFLLLLCIFFQIKLIPQNDAKVCIIVEKNQK